MATLYLIGDPVAHSLSPAMHNAAFRALKLDYAYVAFHVRAAAVDQALAGIRALGAAWMAAACWCIKGRRPSPCGRGGRPDRGRARSFGQPRR